MEINKQEASLLLDLILKSSVTTTIQDAIGGIKLSETLVGLINKLTGVIKEEPKKNVKQTKN